MPIVLRAASCNCNRSTPRARFHSRHDNSGANAHLLSTINQSTFSNRDALLRVEDHKNMFPPNARRLSSPRAPSPCHIDTHHRRSNRDQVSDPLSPQPTPPLVQLLPVPLPDNASRNLHPALAVSTSARFHNYYGGIA